MRVTRRLLPLLLLALASAGCAKRQLLPGFGGDAQSRDGGATLSVRVEGARRAEGLILLSLYDENGGFPLRVSSAVRRVEEPLHEVAIQLRLEHLPPGRYALAVLHDENADRALQTDWLGRPREGYAFSGGVRIGSGLPKFDDAAFMMGEEEQELVVQLIYQ